MFLRIFIFIMLTYSFVLSADNLQKIKVQLQWKHQFEFAGFYAAKEKGFYKDIGLDVELLEYNSNDNIANKILDDEADFGVSYSSIISEYLNGKPIVFLANYFKQSPLVLITQKNITDLSKLRNKRVMGVSKDIDSITLKLMIEKFGLTLDDIEQVKPTFNLEDFVSKKVDAMAVYKTNEIYELEKRSIPYNLFNLSLYSADFYDLNLFTSKNLSIKNPKLVKDFLNATTKGWEYALENQSEVVDIILDKYNTQNKTKDALLFEAKQIYSLMLPNINAVGSIDKNRVRMIANSFVQAGYAPERNLKLLDYMYFENEKKYTKNEYNWLRSNPIIKLAYVKYWDEDTPLKNQHIEREYLNLLNKYSNLNIALIPFNSWSEAYEQVTKGSHIHGIFYLSYSKQREEKYFNYLPPYNYIPSYLFVNKDNNDIKELKDLENKSIYTSLSSINNKYISELPFSINRVPLKNEKDMFKFLSNPYNSVKAGIDYSYEEDALKRNNVKIVKKIYNKYGEVHIGLNKEYPYLHSILSKIHNNIPKSELSAIQNKSRNSIDKTFIERLNLNKEEKVYLNSKPSIKMCVDPDWEPYEKIDHRNKHVGMFADFINLISKKLDKNFQLVDTDSWSQSLEFIKNGKCEIISMINITEDRKKFMNFTNYVYSEPLVIVTKNSVDYLDGFESLNGKTLGIIKGHNTDEYISKNYPQIKIKYIRNFNEGLRLVSKGKIYATLNSVIGASYSIRKLNLTDVKIAGKVELNNQYRIGINKNDYPLYSILSKSVDNLTANEKEKIVTQWTTVKFEQIFDYESFIQIFIVVVIIIIALLYRHFLLKQLNEKLQKKMEIQLKELIRKDKILLQQQKHVAMGEMIDAIAHQWKQPLSIISIRMEFLEFIAQQQGSVPLELMEEDSKVIIEQVNHLVSTLEEFRTFLRPNKNIKEFSLNHCLDKTLLLLKDELVKNGIEISYDKNIDLKILGIENEFKHVFINLINNSKDAFIDNKTEDRKITITFTKDEVDDLDIIEICDNAGGIPEDIIDRVFDANVTSKDESKGTGIGLYMTKQIVEKITGQISVKNSKGGACFKIKLPKSSI